MSFRQPATFSTESVKNGKPQSDWLVRSDLDSEKNGRNYGRSAWCHNETFPLVEGTL